MKKTFYPNLFLILLCLLPSIIFAQSKDMKVKLLKSDSTNFTNLADFNKFFLEKERSFQSEPDKYSLYSIRSWGENPTPKRPSYFRISDEFSIPQMINTMGVAFNPLRNQRENFNLWIGPRLGVGVGNNTKDYVQSVIGAELEAEFMIRKNFSLFTGANLNAVSAKDFNEAATPQNSVALKPRLFELFGGSRYYIDSPQANAKIGLHLKAGMNFWNGMNDEFTGQNPVTKENAKFHKDDYYLSLGVSITSMKPLGRIDSPTFISPETEVHFSPILNTFSTKISQPIRFLDGFSAAITGTLGIGVGNPPLYNIDPLVLAPNANNTVGKFGGLGVDLRFFDYDLNSYVNPYLGWNINFYDFDKLNGASYAKVIDPKYGQFITLGNKINLLKSNWYLDLKASFAFWQKISAYQRDSLGLTMSFPSPIDFNIGIGYKFNYKKEKRIKKFNATYKIYEAKNKEELANLADEEAKKYEAPKPSELNPVSMDETFESVTEERVYIKQEAVKIAPVQPTIVPNWDITDVKFFKVSFRFASELNLFAPGLFDEKNPADESKELLVAMFNKKRCDVKKLKDLNMYLHFNDLDSSRYFGYRYDEYRQLQPETREMPLIQRDSKIGPVYYGKYDEFVKQLKWINDEDFNLQGLVLNGNQIQDLAFRQIGFNNSGSHKNQVSGPNLEEMIMNSDNYQLAFAVYPRETLQKVDEACKNFGVSVLIREDRDKDMNAKDPLNGHFVDGKFIDCDDAAFFSNVVNGSSIYNPEKDGCKSVVKLTDFKLGSAEIIPAIHYPELKKAAYLAKTCNISLFIGFTDSVEFNNSAVSMESFVSDFSGKEIDNTVLKKEFEKIKMEVSKIKTNELSKIQSDELCQKALAFRRIYSVIEVLKSKFGVNPEQVEVAPIGIWPYNKDKRNPHARRVEIRFSKL